MTQETKKIVVDEDKIKETQIVVNVKTLVIIVGFIVTSIGTMYGLLKSDISAARTDSKDEIIKVNTSIGVVQKSVDDLEIVKVQPLDDAFHTLDKQVYFLINRTNSRHENNVDGAVPEATVPTFP